MKTVETVRLILRDYEKRDAEPFFEFVSDRDCCYLDGGYEPETSIKSKRYKKIQKLFGLQTEERFMIELKSQKRCIGTIHIMEDEKRKVFAAEIGYGICPSYQGQGYATEALEAAVRYCFEEMGYEMLTAQIISPNAASLKVISKLGFRKEGVLHKAAKYPPTDVADYELYYLERSDWKGNAVNGVAERVD